MRYRPNPFACALSILGAGLCLGGMGSETAKDLITWPMTAITVAAGVTIALFLASPLAAERAFDAVALVFALLTAGLVGSFALLATSFDQDWDVGLILLALGPAVLTGGAALALTTLVRMRTSEAPRLAPAASGTRPAPTTAEPATAATAPPGWYPDPASGAGQRYWDGSAWGQAYP